jgi:hypothetical protein
MSMWELLRAGSICGLIWINVRCSSSCPLERVARVFHEARHP